MQGTAFAQRHADQPALGGFRRLADGFRHFARLAVAEADATLLVANNNEGGEAEATSTLHNLCDAVDVDELVHELAVAIIAITTTAFTFSCHISLPSLARNRIADRSLGLQMRP